MNVRYVDQLIFFQLFKFCDHEHDNLKNKEGCRGYLDSLN